MTERKYNFSNVPEGEKRIATVTMIVKGGASWAVSGVLTAEQIARIEKLLAEIGSEVEGV